MKSTLLVIAMLTLAIGCGCGAPKQTSTPTPQIVISVLIAPAGATVTVGQVKTFSAREIKDQVALACTACTWRSDNPAVATVTDGIVSAWSPGIANITASLGTTESAPAPVTATALPPPPPPPTQRDLTGNWTGVLSSPGYDDGTFTIPMVRGDLCVAGDDPTNCWQASDFAYPDAHGVFCQPMAVYSLTADVNLDGTLSFQVVEKGGDGIWTGYSGTAPAFDSSLATSGQWTEDSNSGPCYNPYADAGTLALVVVP